MDKQLAAPRAQGARPYVVSAFLIGIPVLALLAIPVYARKDPVIAGFPMFYWWTFLWIALISLGTWTSYRVIGQRAVESEVRS